MKLRTAFYYFTPILVSIVYFLIVTINIQSSPMMGVADNGDFARTTTWLGVSHIDRGDGNGEHMDYVERFYKLGNSFKYGGSFSSGLSLQFLAKGVNVMFHPDIFDLKILGIINTIAFSICIFLFLFYLRKVDKIAFFLAIPFILIIFTDTAYTAYFNSFYEESYGLIFTMMLMSFILKSIGDKARKNDATNLFLVAVSSILLISSKPQYFVLFIPVVLVIELLFRSKFRKITLFTVSLLICIFAISYYFFGTPRLVKKWNVYNTLFAQLLGSTKDSSRAVKILDVDPSFIKYSGIPAYYPGSGVDDPEIQKYLGSEEYLNIIKYYFITPKELINLGLQLSYISFNSRIIFLGYYEIGNGIAPGNQPQEFVFWSNFKETQLVRLFSIVPLLLIISFLSLTCIYMKNEKKELILGIFISISAFIQFLVVLLTEGSFGVPQKHLFLYNIFINLFLLFWIVIFIYWLMKLLKRTKLSKFRRISTV